MLNPDEPKFEIEMLTSQLRPKRSKFAMRLDTVLLLMTLAAVVVGFIQARWTSLQWQSQMNRIQAASGLPLVKDVTKLEVVIEEDSSTPAWTIWVPHGATCILRVTTQQVEIPTPSEFEEYHLSAGRHSIGIATGPSTPTLQLKLDGASILSKEKSRTWNVAGVPETMIRDSIQPVGDKPVVLFRRFGRTRPNPDEVRELRKHRSGLLIWIQP